MESRHPVLLLAFALSGCLRNVAAPAQSQSEAQRTAAQEQVAGSSSAFADTPDPASEREAPAEYDKAATAAASAHLRTLLQKLAASPGFALGHQDTTAYGVGWNAEPERSDVRSVCGAYPAVYGWDLFRIERGETRNGDGVDFEHMRRLIQEAYRRGGVTTISWHSDNPVSGGDAWNTTRAVQAILPGAAQHQRFRVFLERVANFLGSLRGDRGELIPVIFRPFHEHTGSWFWWGAAHTDEKGFVQLWRFTVDFLRQERGYEHLLFAFSPGGGEVRSESNYLYRYPGDDYVDVFGVDHYYASGGERLAHLAEIAAAVAEQHGKVAAITEFGARNGVNASGIDREHWLSEQFLRPLAKSPGALKIAYALAWRNAREEHAFLPYPGHAGEADFKRFCSDSHVLLEDDLPGLR